MNRTCGYCGKGYTAQRSTSVYCSKVCRSGASKRRARVARDASRATASGKVVELAAGRRPAVSSRSSAPKSGRRPELCIEDRAARELGPELVDSALGQQALVIARRLDERVDTSGSAVATLSRQLTALLAEAAAIRAAQEPHVDDATDPIAFLRRRAEERAAGA